jgi:hypothetical protein
MQSHKDLDTLLNCGWKEILLTVKKSKNIRLQHIYTHTHTTIYFILFVSTIEFDEYCVSIFHINTMQSEIVKGSRKDNLLEQFFYNNDSCKIVKITNHMYISAYHMMTMSDFKIKQMRRRKKSKKQLKSLRKNSNKS